MAIFYYFIMENDFLNHIRLAWEEDSNVSFGDEEVSRCKYLDLLQGLFKDQVEGPLEEETAKNGKSRT
jgi:hypothetical protein